MSIKDFEILKKLGEGAYSIVYKAKRKSDSQIYALKQVKFQSLRDKEKENALNEIRLLASVSHPNIVAYKEAFFEETSKSLFIVMEFAESGDLLNRINSHKKNKTRFKEPEIWDIAHQSLRGLKRLHDLSIIHRDIKSANLFLTQDGVVKIGDLNVSKVARERMAHTQTGTPYYASPEVWNNQPYNYKSDVWSLGCVLYEVAALTPPFRADDLKSLKRRVCRGDFLKLPPEYSSELNDLLREMLQTHPGLRPGPKQLLSFPFVQRRYSCKEVSQVECSLLSTIHLPKRMGILSKILPAPQYRGRGLTERRNKNWKQKYPERTYLELLRMHKNSQLLHRMKSSKELKRIQARIYVGDYLKEYMKNRAEKDYKHKTRRQELKHYYAAKS